MGKLLSLLQIVQGIKIETGKLSTPMGTEFVGIKVTVGGIANPDVERTYDDIEKIFKSNQVNFKTHEVRTDKGTFKSYTVET